MSREERKEKRNQIKLKNAEKGLASVSEARKKRVVAVDRNENKKRLQKLQNKHRKFEEQLVGDTI